ncbi:abortive infection protein [Jannaschia pagri]|uniref:Abortive infection protein n=1 Tax=Jannaschia pagri TaxID=2829797 RepID=A0ABQ4NPU1_9RHOB|nr:MULTISPECIES: type II CAAX endopeptidase family protein [unclassified Jannaschia]GIT92718.1 abortive infection protein [Jannaschia sp. AI_61]GIT96422.1 abortive infection protein [Jannaschia sp. AI_62]
MWTPAFDRFVAPARARPQLWRLLVGVVVVMAIYIVTIIGILASVWATVGNAGLDGWMQRIALAETPTAVVLLLGTFGGMFLGSLAAARVMHSRPGVSLFGAGLVRDFVVASGIAVAVFGALTVILPLPYTVQPNTPLDLFLTFLPATLLGILLQTGAEEVLFRGYLQQQLAARFNHWLVWMVLPSIAFGLLHYDPGTAGSNAPWLVAAATLFGLVAADLTRVTGSIGAAWGVHFVNNTIAILVVSLNGSISGASLWTTPFTAENTDILRPLVLQDMLTTIIIWAAIRLWLARRGTAPES